MQSQNTGLRRFTVVFGITMAIMMALSVVLPAFSPNTNPAVQPTVAPPTATPVPTFPPPPADVSTISLDQRYLHPSGLYTVAEPAGWSAVQPTTTLQTARIAMSNTDALSIVQVDVEDIATAEGAEEATLDEVDARYTQSVLASSWSQYNSWRETGDRQRTEDGRLIMDFALTLQGRTYVSRQIAWTDGDWLYSVRVVTPENATELLRYLVQNVADSIEPNRILADSPFDWESHYDTEFSHIIRFPPEWDLEDSLPGAPASILGSGDQELIVRGEADTTIADEEAARAWVEAERDDAAIQSVEPVSRAEGEGYAVSYSFRAVDGEPFSGMTILLNGSEGTLHIADLIFPAVDVDLTTEEGRLAYTDEAQTLASFYVLPNLNVPPRGASPLPVAP